MNHETVNEALRVLRKIEDKPELQRVVEEKGIGAVKPVATIATAETAGFWAQKAKTMSKHTLETFVKELRIQSEKVAGGEAGKLHGEYADGLFSSEVGGLFSVDSCGRPGVAKNADFPQPQAIKILSSGHVNSQQTKIAMQPGPSQKIIIAMQVDAEIADQLQKLKGSGAWNELMREFLQMREERLQEQKPVAVKTESRHIPAKIVRHVVARTNGTCAFPGCKKRAEIFHHTQRFALGKVHDPDRLEPLCKGHERLAHAGLIENENLCAREWRVRLAHDAGDPKFAVDEIVGKFRKAG